MRSGRVDNLRPRADTGPTALVRPNSAPARSSASGGVVGIVCGDVATVLRRATAAASWQIYPVSHCRLPVFDGLIITRYGRLCLPAPGRRPGAQRLDARGGLPHAARWMMSGHGGQRPPGAAAAAPTTPAAGGQESPPTAGPRADRPPTTTRPSRPTTRGAARPQSAPGGHKRTEAGPPGHRTP